jgi:hypothetical protein
MPLNSDRAIRFLESQADTSIITNLFWKEYSRYFCHKSYLTSAADLDFFIVGKSGRAYPIELKSKAVVVDASAGNWFGIDINPFVKLSFFVSLSNNVEFSKLLKYCSWVPKPGGTAMGEEGLQLSRFLRKYFSNWGLSYQRFKKLIVLSLAK